MLTEILTKLGLEEKEAKVYLALLELGQASVMQISQKSGIKRPTAYLVLESLVNKGFVTQTYKKKKLVYVSEEPGTLVRALKRKEELLQEAMPELQAILASTKSRPKISVYEGAQGMRAAYEKILANPEIRWFGSIRHIQVRFPEAIETMQYISKRKKPHVYDLITMHEEDLAYGRSIVSGQHEVRVMPPQLDAFVDLAIFGDKIAIFAVRKDLFAVVIESKEVADSFRSLHALAWKSATPLERIKSK